MIWNHYFVRCNAIHDTPPQERSDHSMITRWILKRNIHQFFRDSLQSCCIHIRGMPQERSLIIFDADC